MKLSFKRLSLHAGFSKRFYAVGLGYIRWNTSARLSMFLGWAELWVCFYSLPFREKPKRISMAYPKRWVIFTV